MRKPVFITISIFCWLSSSAVRSQFLPLNTLGKCEMSEVVISEGFSKPLLYSNELRWLKGLTERDGKLSLIVKDSVAGKVSGDFEIMVYAQSGILRKVAGSITYHFSVESKEGKYRYSFTDFIFHFYVQDRSYRFVKTGKTKPLEENDAMGWHKLWTDHRKTIYSRVSNQIDELKVKIIETSKEVNAKAEEKKVEW